MSGVRKRARVLVWDALLTRTQLVADVASRLAEVRLHPRGETTETLLQAAAGVQAACLAAEVGPSTAHDELLQAIQHLSTAGAKVVCYADHLAAWPLGMRCRYLLAGAFRVLDSAEPSFPAALHQVLEPLLQWQAEQDHRRERLRESMRRLGVVAETEEMAAVYEWVLKVAPLSDLPVLITGETGTGKELLARAIHRLDPKRSAGPFVALNCGAVPAELAESELFGHRRGAFTGGDYARPGLFRAAEGGVLFLDEIGELELGLQAKLLRVLQERRVRSLGEDAEQPLDVRIVAATNRDLSEMTRQGAFRSDLLHRLNVLSVRLPPLRERRADIEPLAREFLAKYRTLKPERSISVDPDFFEALRRLNFPGNVRQLENLVRQTVANKDDDIPLGLSDLPPDVWSELIGGEDALAADGVPFAGDQQNLRHDLSSRLEQLLVANHWNLAASLERCEGLMLRAAIHQAHGNRSQAARMLGVTPRTIHNKLRKHRLSS